MSFRHVALMGRARSGKDTVASRLIEEFQFTRVAFADPLRTAALDLDPIVGSEPAGYGPLPIRLSDLVRHCGWEGAKAFPEVRRTLQRLGEAMRTQDTDTWLRLALAKVDVADTWGLPVVFTDCRHPNEADALRDRGFLLVRVVRPGPHGPTSRNERQHISETALDDYPADAVLTNGGTVAELHAAADGLAVLR
ncbi:deoxynucleotide monophosphate kinase family protein [Streptomyces violascens]|uniref:deoxynucleotide monophosphate kinase family protein n=1 Tax=Streptomyces violascens TaxID=67381 RepID=UPI0036C616BA